MVSSAIHDKLKDVFRQVFDDDEIDVRPELSANDVEDWDSLSHIRLMLTVEKAFGIKFSAAEVGKLKNVGDLVSLIQSKQA
jgi:acyl carrier protein